MIAGLTDHRSYPPQVFLGFLKECVNEKGVTMVVHMEKVEQYRRSVGNWLLGMCGLVLVMIVVGGLTRLTQSGLSMVEWQPIMGSIPPLNHDDWMVAFDKYKQYRSIKSQSGHVFRRF